MTQRVPPAFACLTARQAGMTTNQMKSEAALLKFMMEDIRRVTLKGISGLTKEQLFAEPIKGEFPIGAYLMHLGEAELGWLQTLTGEKQPNEIKKRVYYSAWYDVPPDKYNPPTEPIEPAEYIGAITEARKSVLDYLDSLDDSNLEETVFLKHRKVDVTKKWIFYHLIEHEAHTRGQMFLLIRMAGFKKKGENN